MMGSGQVTAQVQVEASVCSRAYAILFKEIHAHSNQFKQQAFRQYKKIRDRFTNVPL